MVQALGDRAARLRDGFLEAARLGPGAAVRALRHPLGTGADVLETARSIGRTVRPLPEVLSPVMTERGPGRILHTITVGLDELKQAGAAAGGTVNDSFMAGVTGGLRRYHERHGATVAELTVTLPISIAGPTTPRAGTGSRCSGCGCPSPWRTRSSRMAPSAPAAEPLGPSGHWRSPTPSRAH